MFDLLLSLRLAGVGDGDPRPSLAALAADIDDRLIAFLPGVVKAGGRSQRVADAAALGEWLAAAAAGSARLTAEGDAGVSAQLVVRPGGAELHLGFPSGSVALREPALFAAAATLMARFAEEHGETAIVRTYAALSVRNLDYRSVRPPRDYLVADPSSLVDIVDPRAFASADEKQAGAPLLDEALPDGVRRLRAGSATILDWSGGATLNRPEEVAAALTRRDGWLAAHGVGAIKAGWSEAGDVLADPVAAGPHADLTLYSPPLETGWIAIHSASPPAEREAALKRAAQMLAAGSAGQDSPLRHLAVIADSREAALRLRPEIQGAGLKTILYPDDDHLWDPFPDGDWS